jgi:cytochrome b561
MTNTESKSYDTVTRLFHWVTALVLFGQIPAGIAMTSEVIPSLNDALFILHKEMGSVFLVLVFARVVWKLTRPVPALLPQTPILQRRIASLTHGFLYVLLVVLPISGYIRTIGDGYPIELLDAMNIPPLLSGIPEIARQMLVLHKFSAYLLTALIAVHIAAAVQHDLVMGDGVITRIWPPIRRRGAHV